MRVGTALALIFDFCCFKESTVAFLIEFHTVVSLNPSFKKKTVIPCKFYIKSKSTFMET